mgnify:CR=1 FL=1
MFSILIPTYNNLNYLKLCINSIKKNSLFDHEIIVFVNDGSDGTLSFVKKNSITYIHSKINVGLCVAVNKIANLASNKYIVYAHDDMYFCPHWDEPFVQEITNLGHDNFYLSGSMIQPFSSFINLDCGKNIEEFNEEKLLREYKKIYFPDFQGSTWAPTLISLNTWNKVSGFDEKYKFGLGSDPDFNMKLWQAGIRIYKGLGNSRVYHFGSISLRKKVWNDGHKTFLLKWGITIKFFKKFYLRSNKMYDGPLKEPKKDFFFLISLFICKIKLIYTKVIKFNNQ